MNMSSAEYVFLENLALDTKYAGVENTEYGSLMLESTIGRRFLVETLFLETEVKVKSMGVKGAALSVSQNKNKMAEMLAKEFDKLIVMYKRSGDKRQAKKMLEAKKKMLESFGIYYGKDSESSKEGLSIMERFKKIFSKFSDWGKDLYSTVVSFIKKHPYKSIAIAMAAVSFITYMAVEQKDLSKKILNFIKNMVTFPFRKLYQGLTWVISKIFTKSNFKFSESVINQQFTYCTGLYESVMFLSENLPVLYTGEEIKETEKSIFKKVFEFIKRYGWEIPRRGIISLIYKYTKLFYKSVKDNNIDDIVNELDILNRKLEVFTEKNDNERIKLIKEQIDSKKQELAEAKWDFIKQHWKPIVISLVVLAVVASVAIYYYKKKKQTQQQGV